VASPRELVPWQLVFTIALLAACASVTPQQNLQDQLARLPGKSEDLSLYYLRSELLLSEGVLPNGNVERRYRYTGDCVLVVEVNPVSRVFTRAEAHGSRQHCALPP
jgi:hypothetical protein